MSAYFDASALTAIVLRDRGWEKIATWLREQDDASWYSDFGRGEMYSALGNAVRRRDVTEEYAHALIARSSDYLERWTATAITSADIAAATEMLGNFALNLRLPDAIHVATARRLGIALISTDIQQVRAARVLGIAAINPLEADEIRS